MHLYSNRRGRFYDQRSPDSAGRGGVNGAPPVMLPWQRPPPPYYFNHRQATPSVLRYPHHQFPETKIGFGLFSSAAFDQHGKQAPANGAPFRLPPPPFVTGLAFRSPFLPTGQPDYSKPPPPLFTVVLPPHQPTNDDISQPKVSRNGSPPGNMGATEQERNNSGTVNKIGHLKAEDWDFLLSLTAAASRSHEEVSEGKVQGPTTMDPRLKRRRADEKSSPPGKQNKKPTEQKVFKEPVMIDASIENSHSPPFWNRYLNPSVQCYSDYKAFPLDITEKDPRFAYFCTMRKRLAISAAGKVAPPSPPSPPVKSYIPVKRKVEAEWDCNVNNSNNRFIRYA
ncbi:hypothetical protein BV898_10587 [Hypsibius exemplaris]|uniref:Uncharacterized protein n=1 Tax=Hypsibius exemplaris TaxID=2072580 RepID=A0A1W0WJ98_HYPEX|nr:hypothetical protein BV898_10587 [Hypsibius exemplaris]